MNRASAIIAIAAAVFVLAVWGGTWVALGGKDANVRGTFGDMFGGANALFSGLVLVGVLYAIFLQRDELRTAKDDLKATKQILDEQQEQLASQNEATRKQMFETTFFNLLTLTSQSIEGIDQVINDRDTVRGKMLFPILVSRLQEHLNNSGIDGTELTFDRGFASFYAKNNAYFAHYFRTLCYTLKFIESSGRADAKFYVDVVRAQQPDAEIGLLFHYGLSEQGRAEFKPLIEKYSLLRGLLQRYEIHSALKSKYDPSAFAEAH